MLKSKINHPELHKKTGHKLFAVLMFVFVALFFVRNVFEIEFPIVLFLGVAGIIAIVSSREELVALVISFIPFAVGFQYKYAILICIAVYIIKFARTIKYPKYAFAIVAMFVWELFHAFGWEFSPFEALRGFSELIFLALILMADDFDFSDGLVMRTMAYCTVAAVIIVMLVSLKEYNYDFMEFLELGVRFGEADEDALSFGFNFNQNALGFICNIGIAGMLMLLDGKKAKIFDFLSMGILLFIGLLTISRSFVICFLIIVLFYVFAQTGTLKKKVLGFVAIILFFLILLLIINAVAPKVFENIIDRFQESDITGGRNDLFAFYNKHIFSDWKHLLFGVGMQNYGEKVNRIHNTNMNVSHNGYQELVIIWGIVGLTLFIYLLYQIVAKTKKNGTLKLINYMPLVVLLVKSMSGQFITSGTMVLCIVFAYTCLLYRRMDE